MSTDAVSTPKKTAVKAKKPVKKAEHPPVASMVDAAITSLKDRKGSSLAAIKKYIAANYKVDIAKLAPFVRRYLKKAVADGKLNQVKGSGASGSFKLAKVVAEKKEKKPAAKKPAAKKPAAKKPAAKKPTTKKTPKKAAKKATTPKKEKKAKKPASSKPKKPKAKTATKSPKKTTKPKAKKAAK